MKIKLIVKNASYIQAFQNIEHEKILKSILSYTSTYTQNSYLMRSKASFFRYNKFGLGLLPYVKEKLDKFNEEYEIIVPFKFKPLDIKKIEDVKLNNKTLEDYQIKCLGLLDKKIKRGIIQAPTAAGKTTIAAAMIDKLNRPNTLIVVPTTDIARNTIKSISNDLQQSIGIIGDGEFKQEQITVILYQSFKNILKKKDILNHMVKNIELIIWDEAHIASKAIEKCLTPFVNTFYRFGLSATPKLKYNKRQYFQITSQLGPVIHKIVEEQAESRVITDVKCIMWNFKGEKTQKLYSDIYRTDVLLNKRRCKLLLEMVNYSFQKEKRFNCLMLVDEMEQAKLIEELAKKFFDIPEPVIAWSGLETKEVEAIKEGLNTGDIPFVIATTKFSVGTDIPEVETIVIGSARKSTSNLIQKVGRGRRKTEGKKDLLLMDCFDIIGKDDKFFHQYSIKRMNVFKRKKWLTEIRDGKYSNE